MSRTPKQVRASARAMDTARRAGLSDTLLAIHLAVVGARRGLNPWPPHGVLEDYVNDPRVRAMDEIAWAAARAHLSENNTTH